MLIFLEYPANNNIIEVEGDRYVKSGCWDSIHVIEAIESENKSRANYKLTTTVLLSMVVDKPDVGETNWSGTLTRQVNNHITSLLHLNLLCLSY
jgi:hypothetical protein